MAKIVEIENSPGVYLFECPACGHAHSYNTINPEKPIWQFNGSLDSPTFTPSLLVQWKQKGEMQVCHLFVTDGNIHFCPDCTHGMAGQVVPMKDI